MSLFMDQYVLAGLTVVVLTIGFLVAFAVFVWKDSHKPVSALKHGKDETRSQGVNQV